MSFITPPHTHTVTFGTFWDSFQLSTPTHTQEYDDVSALVYTLRAVLGGGNLTTQPPNTELTSLSCATSGDCKSGTSSGADEPCDTDASTVGAKGGSKGKGGVAL